MILEPHFDTVLILITNRCNITCKHCYVSSHPHGEFGLDKITLIRLIDEILSTLGPVCLTLSGGEPLTRAEDTFSVLEYAQDKMPLLLLTNAMLINRNHARRLANINGLTIRLSLDGANQKAHDWMRGDGSFNKVINNIALLKEEGFPVEKLEIFSTIPAEHVSEIDSILTLATDIGIQKLKLEPIAKTGRSIENWPNIPELESDRDTEIYRTFFENKNSGNVFGMWSYTDINDTNFSVLNIYSDGSVFPYTFQDDSDRASGLLGNIHNHHLGQILNKENLSNAVISKSIRLLRGPARSLRAIRIERVHSEVIHDISNS